MKWTNVLRSWLQGLFEISVFLPILLLAIAWVIPSPNYAWIWIGSMALYYLLGVSIRLLSGERTLLFFIPVYLSLALIVAYLSFGLTFASIILAVCGVFALFRSGLFVGRTWRQLFPVALYVIGPISYFIGYIAFTRIDTLTPYSPALIWVGIANLSATLFLANATTIQTVSFSEDGKKPPISSLSRSNQLYVSAIILLVLLIGSYKTLSRWFYNVMMNIYHGFIDWIKMLLDKMNTGSEPPDDTPQMEDLPDMGAMFGDKGSEKPFWEHFFKYVAIALLTAVALLMLFFIIRKIVRNWHSWMRAISDFFMKRMSAPDQIGYVDEKENLGVWKELTRSYRDRFNDWMAALLEKEPKWEQLTTNNERVRYLYRHFVLARIADGYAFKSSYTAKEVAEDIAKWKEKGGTGGKLSEPEIADSSAAKHMESLVNAYNEASYSDREVAEGVVDQLKSHDISKKK